VTLKSVHPSSTSSQQMNEANLIPFPRGGKLTNIFKDKVHTHKIYLRSLCRPIVHDHSMYMSRLINMRGKCCYGRAFL